ncbi:nuclear RNA export factor 1-like [Pogonomyrmex barbatus]|uniref:Nuclear RNA export factor 1-like n=1 Tax=Pogonomyrmex barbatus TaxID=144034 RepID=A0A6I9WL12_9HYME|nr:nuclear RNA export factor 1-like [Pogonomyrmex barbatus]
MMPWKLNKSKIWDDHNIRGNENKSYFRHDNIRRNNNGSNIGPIKHCISFKNERFNNREKWHKLPLINFKNSFLIGSNKDSRQVIIVPRDRDQENRAWQIMSQKTNNFMPNRNLKRSQSDSISHSLPVVNSNYYRIIIPYGSKYKKDDVIRSLLNFMAQIFVPIMYKVIGMEASFYVDDFKMANALVNCDRKIIMTDGFKLQVKLGQRKEFPVCEINDKLKERLKQAMEKRYIRETNALDLSKFHLDPDLVSDYFCALFHPDILMTVLNIVAEYIPNLEILNLEDNKLQNIERLSILSDKFLKLKIFYIGKNKIRDIQQLDSIKNLELSELKLTGNPVCYKYKSRQSDYVSDVRKRFPKLMHLDGMELPRPIVFDVDETKIPSSQRIFVTDVTAREIAGGFLQQYFTVFDSENRQALLNAYDKDACFSMTITDSYKLNGYFMENRNLLKINDTNKRHKLLKQGRLPVVSLLSEMSRTRHLLNTFTMDISLVTQAMMFITLTGYFQELNKRDEPIRHFNRTFMIVPEGDGYCIRNEQLHISQPPEAQLKQLRQQLNQQLNNQQTQQTPAVEVGEVARVATMEPSEEIKQQMTVTLSQQTTMNLEWSLKCLREMEWNYGNALSAFQEFYKCGQIPLEAFTK